MSKKLDPKDVWVRRFEVPEFQKHKKGFTVYKVVSTVFPKEFPEGATKITVWKRYKEFKTFHKELETLFTQLYLKGKFPPLPKDQFFGRFDSKVIEQRRRFCLELLEFSATYSQLFLNKAFVSFFEDGFAPKDFIGEYCNDQNGSVNVLVEDEVHSHSCLVPEQVWTPLPAEVDEEQSRSTSPSYASPDRSPKKSQQLLAHDDNNTPNTSNPQPSLDTARGMLPEECTAEGSLEHHSNPQQNLNSTTKETQAVEESSSHCDQPNYISTKQPPFNSGASSKVGGPCPVPYTLENSKSTVNFGSSSSLTEDFDYCDDDGEFERVRPGLSAMASSASSMSLSEIATDQFKFTKDSFFKKPFRKSLGAGFNLFDFLPIFSQKADQETEEQKLSQSLSSYVREAAGHFTVAHQHESGYDYEKALSAYTDGISILLQGAQGDQDTNRRFLVKKKVEKYLSHAELLKEKIGGTYVIGTEGQHISTKKRASSSISTHSEGFVMLSDNVLPSAMEELSKYKVVGSTHRNILVAVDISGSQGPDCFAIKVVRKSPLVIDPEKPSIIPNAIPFMVQLHQWFNTNDAIVLVLQYAGGGRLLSYINSYERGARPSSAVKFPIVASLNHEGLPYEGEEQELRSPAEIEQKTEECGQEDKTVSPENTEVPKSNQNGLVIDDSLASKAAPLSFPPNDSNTDKLIENSKTLLQTVSKTLEQGRVLSHILDMDDDDEAMSHSAETNPNPSIVSSQKEDALPDNITPGTSNTAATTTVSDDSPDEDGEEPPVTRVVPETCLKVWAAEMVIALDKLHSQGITYGDLDTGNILLGDNGQILLAYRAMWNEVDCKIRWNDFSAPEVIGAVGKSLWKFHPSVDWWSLGAILYLIVTGNKLQDAHPEGIHPQTILIIPEINQLGDPLSSGLRSFLTELLQFTPNVRLGYYGAEEIKTHPFFASFDWIKVQQQTGKF